MKNGDLPAMPVEEGHLYQSRCDNGSWARGALGLSKREMFAMAAMQGILSAGVDYTMFDDDDIASSAVNHADNLLAQLERTK